MRPTQDQADRLIEVLMELKPTKVVTGGARGADALGKAIALHLGIEHEEFPADWTTYGRVAGPIRNRRMAEAADMLIAFPGGRGTANMISEMEKRNKSVIAIACEQKELNDE